MRKKNINLREIYKINIKQKDKIPKKAVNEKYTSEIDAEIKEDGKISLIPQKADTVDMKQDNENTLKNRENLNQQDAKIVFSESDSLIKKMDFQGSSDSKIGIKDNIKDEVTGKNSGKK